MQLKENKEGEEKSYWRIKTWFPDLAPDIESKLFKFFGELNKYNKALNLVSAKNLAVADAVHFADSIYASRIIRKDMGDGREIYDLGSGNGFPGIVFAILFPEVSVHLVDFDPKKCEFLKHVLSECQVKNAVVENKQIDSYPDGAIKCSMTRGLSTISKSIYLTRKVVGVKGVFYHLKGEEWGMEVGEIPIQLCSFWAPSLVGEYKLPVGVVKFAVVKTEKLK